MSSLGERVKQLRKAAGLSQPKLAMLVGIKQPSLSYIENNPSNEIKQKTLLALAMHLNTTPQWLSKGEGGHNPTNKQSTLGERIKLTREAKGLSQAELAKIAGVTQSTIGRYEKNEINRPSFNSVGVIASALGESTEYFMTGLGEHFFSQYDVHEELNTVIQSLEMRNQLILLEVAKTLKNHQRPPEENNTLEQIKKLLGEN